MSDYDLQLLIKINESLESG